MGFSRRSFLGAGVATMAAPYLFAADTGKENAADFPRNTWDQYAFHPSTLMLTWHRDPTTTMDVQWVGTIGETSDLRVSYRPINSPESIPVQNAILSVHGGVAWDTRWHFQAPKIKPYAKTDLKVFRAELSGLLPGTDYEFRIGKFSPTYRFKTMPAKATDTIHFVSGGDVGVNAHAIANNIQAARQDPMFAIVGGDLGYDNGRSVEISLAFLKNYSRHMVGRDGRLIPLLACIGNHEVDGGYGKPREKAPFFYALFDGLFPETGYRCLDFGDYLSLVLLDTGHTSAIAGEQTDWLAQTLKERKDHPHVFVVNHVPAYPSYRKAEGTNGKEGTGEAQRKNWVPLYERFRVPVVLEHHDHMFKRTKPLIDGHGNDDGVLYLGDGTWGRLRVPNKPEKLSYMATSGSEFHMSLHRIQGQERFHLALDENGRVMDVARTAQRLGGSVPVRS